MATTIKFTGTTDISAYDSKAIAALSPTDLASFSKAQALVLTADQMAGFSATTLPALANVFKSITPDVLSGILPKNIIDLPIKSVTLDQIKVLDASQLSGLTPAQVGALSTAQMSALTTVQMRNLTSSQLGTLSSNQVAALSTSQTMALSSVQFAQITNHGGKQHTPIVLDLDGNGIQTLSVNAGVNFDLLANGQPVQTGWVGSGDGLLVMDRNQDGSINDGSELFGSSTVLADGSKAVDGYQALAQLDTNQDGVISSADAQFAKLGVWVDGNADGQTGGGEVKSLAQLNIAQLSLSAQVTKDINNGNLVGLTSSYQTNDGVTHTAADVWFVVKPAQQPVQPTQPTSTTRLAQAIGQFAGAEDEAVQANRGEDLANVTKADGQLMLTTQMVEAMRAFAAQDAALRIGTIGQNTVNGVANAGSLAVGIAGDEKVKTRNSTDADVSGLYSKR